MFCKRIEVKRSNEISGSGVLHSSPLSFGTQPCTSQCFSYCYLSDPKSWSVWKFCSVPGLNWVIRSRFSISGSMWKVISSSLYQTFSYQSRRIIIGHVQQHHTFIFWLWHSFSSGLVLKHYESPSWRESSFERGSPVGLCASLKTRQLLAHGIQQRWNCTML